MSDGTEPPHTIERAVSGRDSVTTLTIIPAKTDVALATELKSKIATAFADHVLPLVNEAKAAGFDVGWALGQSFDGKIVLAALKLTKEF